VLESLDPLVYCLEALLDHREALLCRLEALLHLLLQRSSTIKRLIDREKAVPSSRTCSVRPLRHPAHAPDGAWLRSFSIGRGTFNLPPV
jgi:hypothetical protein